jgi:eukaryotic-like serine/threonine-protein kinase
MNPDRWACVKRVFDDALARDTHERSAFVAQACGTDDVLRAEVERLLAAHADAGDFIERPSAATSGRRIGRYEIGRLLGAGGMGEVYAARDTELGRDVAVKIATAGAADSRLRREAKHASRLNHPHICTIHEVGTFEGELYLVMEYVEGQPLSNLVRPDGLPVNKSLRYGIQVADALAHAHERDVVHRDLKGENVIITPHDRAKILDFGLAHSLSPQHLKELSASQESITAEGAVAGTLSYMAPELLRGARADARSDIWALGVLLYEMVAGRCPFAGATGFELSAAILHDRPAPLPAHVPGPLQDVIRRCLEKNRDDRYQLAADVRSALEMLQAESKVPSLWRLPSRALAAGVLLALLGGGALTWRLWSVRQPAAATSHTGPAVAILTFDNLSGNLETVWLSKGVPTMLLTALAQTPGLAIISTQRLQEVSKDNGARDLESLDRAHASDVARRAGATIAVAGSIVKAGPAIRIDAQVDDLSSGRVLAATSVAGSDVFALVDQLALRIRDSVGFRVAGRFRSITEVSSESLEAYRLYSNGVDAFANMRLDSARALLEQAVALDPTFAEAYLQLALLSGPAGRPADRSSYLRRAAEHSGRLSEPRRLLMEVELARDQGQFRNAARALDRLVARFPGMDAVATLAWQLHAPVVGPLPDVERVLALTSAVKAANPSSTLARNTHGYALLNVGRFADAIREFEEYARLAPREPNPYDGLGDAYVMAGFPEKALESYSRARAIDPTFASPGRAWALAILGRYDEALRAEGSAPYLTAIMLARVGRYAEAHKTTAEALRTAEAGGNLAALSGLYLLSAVLAIEQHDYERALEDVRAARAALEKLPEQRKKFSLALLHLIAGAAELRAGRPRAAHDHYESQGRLYQPAERGHWWRYALEGEIALSAADFTRATAAFERSEPPRKQFVTSLVEGSVLANDLVFRDGLARVAVARWDLRGAIDIYRRLLTYGPEQKWVAVFEPRYVLELARLHERAGDAPAARAEYERFLDFWKNADPALPEPFEARKALIRLRGSRGS